MTCTHRLRSLGLIVLLLLACCPVPVLAQQVYVQHNLVSDIAGLADHTNTNLVNAWGIVHSVTSPWWVNAAGTGLSLVFNGSGDPFPLASSLVVTIPPPPGGQTSTPTGIVFNGTSDFQMAPGKPAVFLFAAEDGTISGWNPGVDSANAVREVNRSGIAIYTGLAMGTMSGANILLAADFHNARIDAFDASFNPVTLPGGAFSDPAIPAGFAPFNVQNVGGSIFITYAKQDATARFDVAGAGLGYVDQFSLSGDLLARMAPGPWMNAPWGVAAVAQGFGLDSDDILVGNFGSGQIAIFKATGEFEAMLSGQRGQPITIDGLWGIMFGNGGNAGPANALFFAAGIQGQAHGLFGTLMLAPPSANNGENDNDQGEGDDKGNGNDKGKGDDKGKGNGNGKDKGDQ